MFLEILFWVLIGIEAIVCLYSAIDEEEMESPGMFTLGLLGFFATMYFMKHDLTIGILTDIKANWPTYLLRVGSYVLLGLLWSMFKWFRKAYKAGKDFKKWSETFNEEIEREIKNRTKKTEQEILNEARIEFDTRRDAYMPKASENKGTITLWAVMWPFSVIRYIIGNALKDFFSMIFNKLKGVYDAISDKAFGKTKFEFRQEEEK